MYTAIRRTSSQIQSATQLCSRLHVSAVNLGGKKRKSRTRLARDLEPSSAKGRHEEAPPVPKFERAAAPHQDADALKKFEPRFQPSQFRTGRRDQPRPSRDRRSSWSPRDRSPFASVAETQAEVPENRKNPYQTLLSEDQQSEFYHPPSPVSLSPALERDGSSALPKSTPIPPTTFSSPPLLPSFLPALSSMLGDNAKPTPIQGLSIKWLIEESGLDLSKSEWKQFLLASETGSGKSLAYLLPLLQKLKLDEQNATYTPRTNSGRPLNPRAIILAPTHELSRQLSLFAKALTHGVKLRVLCASRTNTPSTTKSDVTTKKLSEQLDNVTGGVDDIGELEIKKDKYPVDILIGTPVKIMELIRGRGWDRLQDELTPDAEGNLPKLRRGRDKMPGVGQWKAEPTLGLENVEWVVIDEADVLFDPDFQEITRTLLADISTARGKPVQIDAAEPLLSSVTPVISSSSTAKPINYPFNFILTSATIPRNLATYLDQRHPHLVRLTSPRVHNLPKTLKTEFVSWSGGNKFADIERRIRKIWAEDAVAYNLVEPGTQASLSKILIFRNKGSQVDELAAYFEEKGIKCVALTGKSEQRQRGSNKHLEGFMRPVQINPDPARTSSSSSTKREVAADPKVTPHVMIATSLLSRGLDFSPDLGHVFIVDEPRNTIDLLHRAGRSGRAGRKGKVVIFMKTTGRGSARSEQITGLLKDLRGPRK